MWRWSCDLSHMWRLSPMYTYTAWLALLSSCWLTSIDNVHSNWSGCLCFHINFCWKWEYEKLASHLTALSCFACLSIIEMCLRRTTDIPLEAEIALRVRSQQSSNSNNKSQMVLSNMGQSTWAPLNELPDQAEKSFFQFALISHFNGLRECLATL